MKLMRFTPLIQTGPFPTSKAWARVETDVRSAIAAVRWPPDGPDFTIYPQSGKKRGEGNGVKPIKDGFVTKLTDLGWKMQQTKERNDDPTTLRPGSFDAWLDLTEQGYFKPFVIEWETGNISSSHRAMNKMALGVTARWLSGGILVLSSRSLAQYLTDRIGNYRELEPYFPLWRAVRADNAFLGVIEVEHDRTSMKVPRISKGTDGRALI
jgi:hypothetical protein